jgi:hypothetical protein
LRKGNIAPNEKLKKIFLMKGTDPEKEDIAPGGSPKRKS